MNFQTSLLLPSRTGFLWVYRYDPKQGECIYFTDELDDKEPRLRAIKTELPENLSDFVSSGMTISENTYLSLRRRCSNRATFEPYPKPTEES